MNLLFTFVFKEKVYCVYSKNNELTFGYQKEGVFFPDLLEEEKVLISLVISKLGPSTNLIELDDLTFNDKIFKRYFDIETNLTLFSKLVNNILVTPSTEETKHLNLLFNNQLEYVSLNSSIEELPFYKRLIKLGKEVIIVLVTTATVLSCLPTVANAATLNKDNNKPEITVNYDAEIEEIKRIIRTNPKLTEQEKDLTLEVSKVLDENKEFLEIDTIKENMENLDFIYNPNNSNNVKGCYYFAGPKKYTIEFFNATKLEDVKKDTISHEILHSMSTFKNYGLGNSLMEFINVEFNNEYIGENPTTENYDNGYYWLENYCQIIYSIIEKDILMEFHFKNDSKIIVNELKKINPDEKVAIELLQNMDLYSSMYSKTIFNMSDEQKLKLNQLEQKILKTLKEYYEMKYKTKIEKNLNLLFYFNKERLCKIIADTYTIDYSVEETYVNTIRVKKSKYNFNRSFFGKDNKLIVSIPTNFNIRKGHYSFDYALEFGLIKIENGQYVSIYPENHVLQTDNSIEFTFKENTDFIDCDLSNMPISLDYANKKEEITRK